MKGLKRNSLIIIFVSILSAIIFSLTALAQTEISVNKNNIIRIGADVTIAPKQKVENAHAIGGDVTISEGARVTQTAIAVDGDVILEKGARVDGDVYAIGGKIIAASGATIGGTSGTAFDNGRVGMYGYRKRGINNFFRYLFHTGFYILNVAIVTIIGVALILWRPNFLLNLAANVREYPLQCGLWGLGGLFAVILLIIFLAVSLVGIPLLPLVGLAVTVVFILGNIGIALLVGQRILNRRERTTMQEFLIGMLILCLIGLIPILGGLVSLAINTFGSGALIIWLLSKRRAQSIV